MIWTEYLIWVLAIIIIVILILHKLTFFKSGRWKIVQSLIWIIFHVSTWSSAIVPQPRIVGVVDFDHTTFISIYGWIVLIIGVGIMVWSFTHLGGIIKQIQGATLGDMQVPNSVLTNGNYKKIRHPMYAYFLIGYSGFFCGFGSFVGILLCLIFGISSYHDAILEEKKQLIPLFQEKYNTYKDIVKHRFFNKNNFPVFLIPYILMFCGLILYGFE
ncbi:MAG: methyltransferase family protein [Candidatus Helarchaeota archaeon]